MAVSTSTLIMLLAVYSFGALWVVALLWLTVMKFSGWLVLERPAWLFGSVPRSMAIVLASAAVLLAFDLAVRRSGVL